MPRTFFILFFLSVFLGVKAQEPASHSTKKILAYEVDARTGNVAFYYQDEDQQDLENFKRLKEYLEEDNQELVFATNGGMYMEDRRPLGLYIENGRQLRPLNTRETAHGNFYLQPNGVFTILENGKTTITTTKNFHQVDSIKYATQSGPMLVIEGALHPAFNQGSKNLNIRNGVGVLPNGNLLFAMSKSPINFFDFATYFKEKGCENALYLDGFVSRSYLPEQNWVQEDGKFGVMIGVVK